MIPQIPGWFFTIDALMDLLLAALGFVVSYYGLKLYQTSSKRSHFNLHLAFTILSTGFLVNGITGIYAILNSNLTPRELLLGRIVNISNFGYWIYFAASLAAYFLFASMYFQENKRNILPVIMIPFWFDYFAAFNVISILMLSYVVFQTIANYLERKSRNALKVTWAFALLLGYHVLLAFSPFSELAYLAAHLSALFAFLLLIAMIRSISSSFDRELGIKRLARANRK